MVIIIIYLVGVFTIYCKYHLSINLVYLGLFDVARPPQHTHIAAFFQYNRTVTKKKLFLSFQLCFFKLDLCELRAIYLLV